jgi:O-antigen ligase
MQASSLTVQQNEEQTRALKIIPWVLYGAMFVFLISCFFSIAVNSIAQGLMAIAWLALMIHKRRWLVASTPLDYFFLAYVIAEFLSTVFSIYPEQSVVYSKRLLQLFLVYFMATHITSLPLAKKAVATLLISGVVLGIFGVLKLIIAPPEETVRLGIFQFYMTTSELLMIIALWLLPFVIHPDTPKGIRWGALVGMVPVLISLYATVTRGAYLATAAGMIFIAIVRSRWLLVPIVALIVLLILFAPPYVYNRVASIADIHHPENRVRLQLWSTGLVIFQHYPIVGVGDIDLREMYELYATEDDPTHSGHMHNIAMQVLVTLGIVGFVAVAAMFVKIIQTEWQIYRALRKEWFHGSVVLGAMATFVGIQVTGLTEWSFGDQEIVTLLWVTLGLSLALSQLGLSNSDRVGT